MPETSWHIWGSRGASGCDYCVQFAGPFSDINKLHPPQQSSYSFFRGMFCNDLEDARMILEKTEAGIKVLTRKCLSTPHQPRFGWLLTPRVMNSWLLQLPGCRHWFLLDSLSIGFCTSWKAGFILLPFCKARKSVGCDTSTCNIKFPFDYKLLILNRLEEK